MRAKTREWDQAQRVYSNAKRTGQRASPIEQERPNVFTTSVANIAPNSKIVIETGYHSGCASPTG